MLALVIAGIFLTPRVSQALDDVHQLRGAAIGWLITSLAFSWYAANFGSYNATYGSLGGIVGFMMWIWLSTIVVLAGAEIDATIEAGRAAKPSASR